MHVMGSGGVYLANPWQVWHEMQWCAWYSTLVAWQGSVPKQLVVGTKNEPGLASSYAQESGPTLGCDAVIEHFTWRFFTSKGIYHRKQDGTKGWKDGGQHFCRLSWQFAAAQFKGSQCFWLIVSRFFYLSGCPHIHQLDFHRHADGEKHLDGVGLPKDQGILQGATWTWVSSKNLNFIHNSKVFWEYPYLRWWTWGGESETRWQTSIWPQWDK